MSDIKQAIQQIQEPSKSIGNILLDYYELMKKLESHEFRGGKQATATVMAINDIENLFK